MTIWAGRHVMRRSKDPLDMPKIRDNPRSAAPVMFQRKRKTQPMIKRDIDNHPLLTDLQRADCHSLTQLRKQQRAKFTMFDFAEASLRASGCRFAHVASSTDSGTRGAADLEHKRAAVLYVYEALKARGITSLLENLTFLAGDLS